MADPPRYPDTGVGRSRGSTTGTPPWVKVAGIIGGILVLLVVIMMFTGHGPGRHMPGSGSPLSTATEEGHAMPKGGH